MLKLKYRKAGALLPRISFQTIERAGKSIHIFHTLESSFIDYYNYTVFHPMSLKFSDIFYWVNELESVFCEVIIYEREVIARVHKRQIWESRLGTPKILCSSDICLFLHEFQMRILIFSYRNKYLDWLWRINFSC